MQASCRLYQSQLLLQRQSRHSQSVLSNLQSPISPLKSSLIFFVHDNYNLIQKYVTKNCLNFMLHEKFSIKITIKPRNCLLLNISGNFSGLLNAEALIASADIRHHTTSVFDGYFGGYLQSACLTPRGSRRLQQGSS